MTIVSTVRTVARDVYRQARFERMPNAVRGVFSSFAEAHRAVPARSKSGYDHDDLAALYDNRMQRLEAWDYPLIFWLDRALCDAKSVFDFGGNVGILHYAYASYLDLDTVRWRVCDLPRITARGRELALQRDARNLSFTEHFEDIEGYEILVASGTLQYVETPLADLIGRLRIKPRHVLVNVTPMYDGAEYVTLQNTLHSYNPYKVVNEAAFTRSIEALGYERVDAWDIPRPLSVPFHPECALQAYRGLYFVLKPAVS